MNMQPKTFSGVERAAVLMMLVGEEEAAAILQKLDPEEVRQLGKAMFAVADVSENEVEMVLDDFVQCAGARTAIGFDPRQQITAVMNRALGPEKADSVLARITPPEDACQIELLDWLDAGDIAALIEKEHPQIAAVLIANLDPGVAAQVLELLPDALQPDILHRIARTHGTTVLCVSHDPRLVGHADRVLAMEDGRILSDRVPSPISTPTSGIEEPSA